MPRLGKQDGACLQSTPPVGPPATMGDVCTLVPFNDWNCSTPLRNPFTTDVVFAPFLLPGYSFGPTLLPLFSHTLATL